MLRPIIGNRPKHKRFNYEYRHYKPEPRKPVQEEKPQMKFKRISRRGTAGSVFVYAILLSMILWILT